MRKNNNRSLRKQDPFLAREQQKYDHPLPSREWIIGVIEKEGMPISIATLKKKLSILPQEAKIFDKRLHAMIRDGQILMNRKGLLCIAKKLALVKCRVEVHKDGFGFAIPLNMTNKQNKDFVLYPRQMRGLMQGDVVMVRPVGVDKKGRQEAHVLDILERACTHVVGKMLIEYGVPMLEPIGNELPENILLDSDGLHGAKPNQIIVAEIIRYPIAGKPAIAQVREILGNDDDSGMEIEIAVRKYHLPHVFSDGCLKEAKKLPSFINIADYPERVDLRDMPLVTIDGETARDFDDAVFAEKVGRSYRLVVAIADVSHYVRPNTELDKNAHERATSVYFPRRVIPMLPEKLSNDLCSLNPKVDRLAMVCDMFITRSGNIKSYQFYPAVICSHARLTYQQVWTWIEHQETAHPLMPHIQSLYSLFHVLLKKRQQRGAMDFDTRETQMLFNDQGKICSIIPVIRNPAHRLIEECMLAANVCAADFLRKNRITALFRNHHGPTKEKLLALREQLSLLGLKLGGEDKPTPLDYATLMQDIDSREDKNLIQVMLLRSMQQAVYAPKNEGHFGLAYPAYTHFTSPIRRYPDLLVHRAIKAILEHSTYQPESWHALGEHCSQLERRAEESSRYVESWLKTYFMKDKVGDIFTGCISGLTNFGIFVTLDDIYIEGMVHISELGKDYYYYRPEMMAIIGERSGQQFHFGDKVVVRVARADLDTRRIELILVDSLPSRKQKTKKTSRKKISKK